MSLPLDGAADSVALGIGADQRYWSPTPFIYRHLSSHQEGGKMQLSRRLSVPHSEIAMSAIRAQGAGGQKNQLQNALGSP